MKKEIKEMIDKNLSSVENVIEDSGFTFHPSRLEEMLNYRDGFARGYLFALKDLKEITREEWHNCRSELMNTTIKKAMEVKELKGETK